MSLHMDHRSFSEMESTHVALKVGPQVIIRDGIYICGVECGGQMEA